ncbi:MAG: glycosyltransferase [Prevotellaceae bacterium]|jgi:hypothetical protein|nr:glycosyltransferase [Prevotellaceae bacterium]
MRIAYFTDTYSPEVNGVTNTLSRLGTYLEENHIHQVVFAPAYENEETFPRRENRHSAYRSLYRFKGLKTSLSPESRLAFPAFWEIDEICDDFKPDLVHVSTELGIGFRGMHALRIFFPTKITPSSVPREAGKPFWKIWLPLWKIPISAWAWPRTPGKPPWNGTGTASLTGF